MAPARCAARFRRSALPSLGLPALALPASTGSTTIERTSASPCPESVLVVFLVVGLDRGLSRIGRIQAALLKPTQLRNGIKITRLHRRFLFIAQEIGRASCRERVCQYV